jgi:predicted nucleotide-binding protein
MNLRLVRQMLLAIEEKPPSLRAFEATKSKAEVQEVSTLQRAMERARWMEYKRGAFSSYLQLTATGADLLNRMKDEQTYTRIMQELDGAPDIDLAELKARFLLAASPGKPAERARAEPQPAPAPAPVQRSRIFLVHGHDMEAREQVTVFLEKIGLDVLALDEQYSAGKTVIEKFEQNADVKYVVVLLTDDDVGGKSRDDLRPRPRQNVVFELGFFMGRLGRERICALQKGNVELPSDISGLVWSSLSGRWKRELANELEKAGYPIDWKKLVE